MKQVAALISAAETSQPVFGGQMSLQPLDQVYPHLVSIGPVFGSSHHRILRFGLHGGACGAVPTGGPKLLALLAL